MPRNGSGGYLPPQNSWNPAINGMQALPNDWMAILNDMAAALQASVAADGQTPITGVLNFQNNRISNVGAPTGQGDALRFNQMQKGADIASAATIAIPIEGNLFDVTGTTTISTINDTFPGRIAFLRFAGEVDITHSAQLILPSGVTAKTSAGDVLCIMNTASGEWTVVSWPRFAAANYPSATEPTITWPLMAWADTANMLLKRRNGADSAWVTLGPLLERAVEQAATPWLGKAVGEVFFIQENMVGATIPPTNDDRYRFIKLTAGDAYNSGALTGESVSGSAPLINATAVISNAGSPMNGQTVRLINTERRVLRAGLPGVLEDGQNESHGHLVSDPGHGHVVTDPGHTHATMVPTTNVGVAPGGNVYPIPTAYQDSLSSFTGISLANAQTGITLVATGGTEARMRNIGVSAYMRIK